jgi:hypothetical protein
MKRTLIVAGILPAISSGVCANEPRGPATGSRARQIAEYFKRDPREIIDLRQQGYSYGEIVKILVIARSSKRPLEALLEENRADTGWGSIARETGLSAVAVKKEVDEVRAQLKIQVQPVAVAAPMPLRAASTRLPGSFHASEVTKRTDITSEWFIRTETIAGATLIEGSITRFLSVPLQREESLLRWGGTVLSTSTSLAHDVLITRLDSNEVLHLHPDQLSFERYALGDAGKALPWADRNAVRRSTHAVQLEIDRVTWQPLPDQRKVGPYFCKDTRMDVSLRLRDLQTGATSQWRMAQTFCSVEGDPLLEKMRREEQTFALLYSERLKGPRIDRTPSGVIAAQLAELAGQSPEQVAKVLARIEREVKTLKGVPVGMMVELYVSMPSGVNKALFRREPLGSVSADGIRLLRIVYDLRSLTERTLSDRLFDVPEGFQLASVVTPARAGAVSPIQK